MDIFKIFEERKLAKEKHLKQMSYQTSSAYNLGCFGVFLKKEDGSEYTIQDWIKDHNITEEKAIERAIKEHREGFKEFCRLQSCIS